jgi:hypothetical protein
MARSDFPKARILSAMNEAYCDDASPFWMLSLVARVVDVVTCHKFDMVPRRLYTGRKHEQVKALVAATHVAQLLAQICKAILIKGNL